MEIKVRAVDGAGEKSSQQLEQEVLDKHAEQESNEELTTEPVKEEVVEEEVKEEVVEEQSPELPELTEEDVLSHINKRYNKQIDSVDELFAEKKESGELPEDVSAYLKYKQETGRGFEDYVKLNRDFEDMDSDSLLREYLISTEDGLDIEDINVLMQDYQYNEDEHEESEIKKIKLAKKKAIATAKKYFAKQKEYYKQPLESRTDAISESDSEELKAYRQYLQESKTLEQENLKKRDWFEKKTDDLFNQEFKGFEFKIGDTSLTYSPGSPDELKKLQSTPYNFINRFIGPDGLLKDATGYHRALAIAMNPEKFAQFFYEQGKSSGTEDVMRKTKNINMSERTAPETTVKGGMKIRSLNADSGKGLKIKSVKRK
mgnify:CR=1 FL=1